MGSPLKRRLKARMENAHAKESADILAHFVVDEETGLSPDQFKSYLAKYGYNGELRGWGGGGGAG